MGCNTSKDSAQAVGKKSTEGQNETEENALNSKGTKGSNQVNSKSSKEEENKPNPEEAATKIQAAFRGHKTRKTMKQASTKPEKSENPSKNTTGQHQENVDIDLNEEGLEEAATKIQASFRGHLVRKQMDKDEKQEGKGDSKNSDNTQEEVDIDLTDPDLNDAAMKIQASFRGHMARKENEQQKSQPEGKHQK
ncbi:neuromodulin-like isoform X2 [Agrilus planipennis]|uniref:Neuromodulin-like isoform X2 n=1 Tax=Agrilus planipennis TaxID=224129 RepID=A0A1W4XL40_AGRPL|nr:neuromodulin-like isoform X2 [Agrilus planipennis]